MSNSQTIQVQLDERVSVSKQRKGASIEWPRLVDYRLDELTRLVIEAGERTTRAELAAAIICKQPDDAQRLRETLTAYRTAEARDVLVEAPRNAKTLELPVHRPGPRPRE